MSKDFEASLEEILKSKLPAFLPPKNIENTEIKNVIGSIRGNWAENYNSWKNLNFAKKIIIKYEDLINNTFENFLKVIVFLNDIYGLKIDEKKIEKSISSTTFFKLQNLEREKGFSEQASKETIFFKKGEIGVWKNKVSSKIVKKLEESFKKEMNELNYL